MVDLTMFKEFEQYHRDVKRAVQDLVDVFPHDFNSMDMTDEDIIRHSAKTLRTFVQMLRGAKIHENIIDNIMVGDD